MDRRLDRAPAVPSEHDAVESALAKAIEGATSAGRWDIVAQLARELEARRVTRMGNVVALTKTRLRSE